MPSPPTLGPRLPPLGIGDDGDDPRTHRALAAETCGGGHAPDEGLLQHVLGIGGVAGEAQGHPVSGLGMALQQAFQGLAVAITPEAIEQRQIWVGNRPLVFGGAGVDLIHQC